MSLLNNFKIGPRLMVSFGIILALLIMISLTSIMRLSEISETTETLIERDVNRVTVASKVNSEAQSAAIVLLELLSTENRDDRVPLYKVIDQHNKNLNEAIAQLERLNVSEVELIKARRAEYQSAFTETVELLELSAEYAINEFKSNTRPKLEALLATIATTVTSQTSEMQAQVNATNNSNNAATTLVIVISVIATVLVILLATTVRSSIVSPLNKIVEMAHAIAGGDIRQPATISGNDELAELNQAFKDMSSGLQNLIRSIQTSSEEICLSSVSLKQPVLKVSSGSDQQQNAVSQIESAISDFMMQSETAVQTTQESITQANQAKELSNQGQSLIDKTTREFDTISNTIEQSVDLVESLRTHALSVSNMVNSVREIADQTNLLALNAAIEAARAGESGRGFSVVADEVRSLAVRASEATNQIDEVIESIMSGTQSAAERIGDGRKELQDGVILLNQLVTPLTELASSAQTSVQQLQSLESAVKSQANESHEINRQISTIASMAKDNHTAVEDVSDATSTITGKSADLEHQINRFTLG